MCNSWRWRAESLKEDDTCVALYKGFTTCVEKSNPGYTWNFDEKSLIGKKLCGVFGLEEYQDQEGEVRTATKLVQFRSLDKLNDIKIPKVKLVDGTVMDYEDYKNRSNKNSSNDTVVVENLDDLLPFEL